MVQTLIGVNVLWSIWGQVMRFIVNKRKLPVHSDTPIAKRVRENPQAKTHRQSWVYPAVKSSKKLSEETAKGLVKGLANCDSFEELSNCVK